jgi:Xaa-Pro aminopeptidase
MSTGSRTAERRDALRATAAQQGLDSVLVTNLLNVRYLTGFTGSNGALLVRTAGDDLFGTDGRYTTQAVGQVSGVELVEDRATVAGLAKLAVRRGTDRLGYESHDLTVDGLANLEKVLADAVGGSTNRTLPELVSIRRAVEAQRAIKDEREIELLRQACAIADQALAELAAEGALRPGRTELEVGRELDARMLRLGAEAVSFETIVATGANSAIPHHRPDATVLRDGDFLKLDFGATVEGYHSDMTRTVVLGHAADWQREIYELVAASQAAGRAALEVGADVVAIDAAARDVIVEAGHGEHFSHGLGHGVGLEIHEAPGIGPLGAGTLAAGMAVTVEPGVYLPDRGGVRIEDTLIVTDDAPELLTLTSKELLVL